MGCACQKLYIDMWYILKIWLSPFYMYLNILMLAWFVKKNSSFINYNVFTIIFQNVNIVLHKKNHKNNYIASSYLQNVYLSFS